MYADYLQTVRMLFHDAEGLEIEEAFCNLSKACEELHRAYEEGASEQEACERLCQLVTC